MPSGRLSLSRPLGETRAPCGELAAFMEDAAVYLKKSVILSCLGLSLTAVASAHETHHQHQAAASASAAAGQRLEPLAARFQLTNNKLRTEWYLWRDADSIETADLATGQNNIWERQGWDDYSYRRVFHRDQRVVEYTPGEIRTRHAEPGWVKLASVISPQLLESLKRGPSKRQFGQRAIRYSGTVNGQKIALWWLEKARLPAHLQIVGAQQRMELNLQEIHAQAPASWPRATDERIAGYGKIDASDFGDMESDPFVARVMHEDGDHHRH